MRGDRRVDEHDIAEVLVRYATGIDQRDWALFRRCFTDDVVAEYEGLATWRSVEEITDYMISAHADLGRTLHRITTIAVDVDGDTATARSDVDAVLMAPGATGGTNVLGTYEDQLVRTADGWRIRHRRATLVHRGTTSPR